MKKILLSVSVIAAVAAVVFGITTAFFSDTETSTGNTFSTGTIDIKIDNQNPWQGHFELKDMKPSETGYITFNIQNPGDNPVNVWKKVTVTGTIDEPINEPECVYNNNGHYGVWDPNSQACDIQSDNPSWLYEPKSNLHDWMYYDLSVFVPIPENKNGGWWQTIYRDKEIALSSVGKVFLGMVPAKGSMKVTQSYHLAPTTENWAQADTMNFDIEIYAEQLKGELVLENKQGFEEATGDWDIIQGDNIGATLTYNLTSPKFNYSLTGRVALASTDYSLIYYADPWPGAGQHNDGTGVLIAEFTSDGSSNIPDGTSGSVDLNRDLPKWPSDQNHPEGAKIWLVPSTHYSATTPGQSGIMQNWVPANYLFETGLITYDDTDI